MREGSGNPYAPPAASPFVLPLNELPSGIRRYRVDWAAARKVVRRRMAVLGRVMLALIMLVMLLDAQLGLQGLSVLVFGAFLGVVGGAAFLVSWFRVQRTLARNVATYELLVNARVLRRIIGRVSPAEILRPEVTRIVETPLMMWVLCASPRRSLGLTRTIEGYAELRDHLARWRPIEPVRGWAATRLTYTELSHARPRDVVAGTALESDPTLAEELATVRGLGADRGLGLGQPTSMRARLIWMLVLWVLLTAMFLGIWWSLQPP
jgi:hypothetical protein